MILILALALILACPPLSAAEAEVMKNGVRKVKLSSGGIARKGYHWNMQAENPAGTKILYVRWPDGLKGKSQIMVCDTDGSGQRVVVDDSFGSFHVGAMTHWINNRQFVHRGKNHEILVRNLSDGKVVRKINCGTCGPVDYNEKTKLILAGNYKNGDVWTVNPFTGEKKKILGIDAFDPWRRKMKGKVPPNIWHRYWNPSGTYVWIKLERPEYGFSFAADGADIKFFGWPGSHPSWWNDKLIYCSGVLKKRNGKKTGIKVARSFGVLCHPGYSPDRKWVAGESNYGSDPVMLWVDYFDNGKIKHFKLDQTSRVKMIWDKKFHVDSSFSRDGNRVYVNWPVSDTETAVFCYDITSLRQRADGTKKSNEKIRGVSRPAVIRKKEND